MSLQLNYFSYIQNPDTGKPLSNGFAYFGIPGVDPFLPENRIQVFSYQKNGNIIEIPNPVKVSQYGLFDYNGFPIQIFLKQNDFSLKFFDRNNGLLYFSMKNPFMPYVENNAGKFLSNNGISANWETILPAQTGEEGNFLTTDGTNTSWSDILPDQEGEDGNFLQTNGTNVSWQPLFGNREGEDGKFLATNGTVASWQNSTFESSFNFVSSTDLVNNISVEIPLSGMIIIRSFAKSSLVVSSPTPIQLMRLTLEGISSEATTPEGQTGSSDDRFYPSIFLSSIVTGTAGSTVDISSTIVFPSAGLQWTYSFEKVDE